jgi:hypothetical protein
VNEEQIRNYIRVMSGLKRSDLLNFCRGKWGKFGDVANGGAPLGIDDSWKTSDILHTLENHLRQRYLGQAVPYPLGGSTMSDVRNTNRQYAFDTKHEQVVDIFDDLAGDDQFQYLVPQKRYKKHAGAIENAIATAGGEVLGVEEQDDDGQVMTVISVRIAAPAASAEGEQAEAPAKKSKKAKKAAEDNGSEAKAPKAPSLKVKVRPSGKIRVMFNQIFEGQEPVTFENPNDAKAALEAGINDGQYTVAPAQWAHLLEACEAYVPPTEGEEADTSETEAEAAE